jgi:hypothetical protein
MDKHKNLCQLIYNSNKPTLYDDDNIPSISHIYKIVVALVNEMNTIKQCLDELSTRVPKNKQKIVFLDWLNENKICNQDFKQFLHTIKINMDMMINLFHDKSFYDILDKVIKEAIVDKETPIIALQHEPNKFYIFQDNAWKLATRNIISNFLTTIKIDIYKIFYDWKTSQKRDDDAFCVQCDNITNMIMNNIDFQENSAYSKGKTILWKYAKQVFQATTEYEFVYE